MIFRTAIVALGLLVVLNGSAGACDGPDCAKPPKVKKTQIRQFMREQAASTTGVVPRAARKLESKTRVDNSHTPPGRACILCARSDIGGGSAGRHRG